MHAAQRSPRIADAPLYGPSGEPAWPIASLRYVVDVISPVTLRDLRPLLLVVLALSSTVGLAACGGGMSQSDIEKKVDAASIGDENVTDGPVSASSLAQDQANKDADQQAAADAVKRRKELDSIEKEQKAEADKVMSGDVPSDAVSIAEQRFRARLAGVCDGAQSRISKVSKLADEATKAKDPQQLLKVAQDYNDALNDFIAALKGLDPPASQQKLYASWLGTIDDLSNTIRLQLVSVADKKAYARLQKKTESLSLTFLTQTAQLGVTCLSVTG